MVDLFFDIETAPNFDSSKEFFQVKTQIQSNLISEDSKSDIFWKFKLGALNPFDGKIILLTYQVNEGHAFFLKEWDLGEKLLLEEFFKIDKGS